MSTAAPERPSVSVVVPFRGSDDAWRDCLLGLEGLRLEPGDELILVDNTGRGLAAAGGAQVIAAEFERSSYYARNVGAEAAASDWLLFMDSDCRPPADLLDAYFAVQPAERTAILAGSVEADPAQRSIAARYASSRGYLDTSFHLEAPMPSGITANLLVRRSAWEALGGFHEGICSAGDVEFCWRAQQLGWALEPRRQALVLHRHPDRIGRLREKARRYGAGRRWLGRRFAEAPGRPPLLRPLARSLGGAMVWTLSGRLERTRFKLIDGAIVLADARGWFTGDNRAWRQDKRPLHRLAVMTDAFPERSETFVFNEMRALRELGIGVRAEASARPDRIARDVSREFAVSYLEDEPTPRALVDLAWLAVRHPFRCVGDLRSRRRWRAEEVVWPLRALAPAARRMAVTKGHLHVHFASLAALHALRISRLAGTTYSVEAHAYDIYQQARNLPEKLERAAFAAGSCDYTVTDLRRRVSPEAGHRIHRLVMGVDAELFRRRRPHPAGRTVVAVGRYVEKKGFRYLIEATALLRDRGSPLERVVVAGSGPLEAELVDLVADLGLEDTVELPEVWGAEAVRELLEGADVFAMPSVIAADGDRDSMPVVVKEALAMEVPVVASDEVGIPEMIEPAWGLLVPPAAPAALAGALGELLDRDPDERARMGAAGRVFVREYCSVATETARLAALIEDVRPI